MSSAFPPDTSDTADGPSRPKRRHGIGALTARPADSFERYRAPPSTPPLVSALAPLSHSTSRSRRPESAAPVHHRPSNSRKVSVRGSPQFLLCSCYYRLMSPYWCGGCERRRFPPGFIWIFRAMLREAVRSACRWCSRGFSFGSDLRDLWTRLCRGA